MKERDEIKDQLIHELAALRQRVAELEKLEEEHNRVEAALRESEDRYRDVVEYSQYLILTHDLKGQILSVNQEGARLLGYDQRSLLKKNVRDLLVPEVKNEFDAYLDTIRKEGSGKGLMLVQTATGEKRIWEYNNTLRTEGVPVPIVRSIAHDVTERLRAEKVVKKLSQENAIMAEIGRIISSTLNIEEVYERLSEEINKLIHFDRLAITSINPQNRSMAYEYISGVDIENTKLGDSSALTGTIVESIMGTRVGMIIQGEGIDRWASQDDRILKTFQAGLRSMISVPLISKDQVIGVLHFRSLKPKAYTESDLRLAERVGNQIAGAISNAELLIERKRAEEALQKSEEEAKRLAQENATVAEIGRIISSTLNIEEVYERFAEEVRKLISFDRISINLFNHEEWTATIAYTIGVDVIGNRSGDVFPLVGTFTEEVMRERSSLLIRAEDIEELKSQYPSLLPSFQAGLLSLMSVPLISKDQVIGVLHAQSLKPNAYSELDLRLVERVGNQIAGAIANAELFNERKRTEMALRESEEINRALFSISNAINTTINLDELYRFIHKSLSQIIDLTNFYISLYHRETQIITFPYAVDEVDEGVFFNRTLKDMESSALTGRVLTTGRPLLVKKEELLQKTRERGEKIFGTLPEVWLGVPLMVKNEVIGVMATQSYTDPNRYNKRDLDILLSVSDQVALAIDRKRADGALRESEEKYRVLVENANEAIVVTQDGVFKFANPKAVEFTGYSYGELVNKLVAEVIHPDDREMVTERYRAQLRGEKIPRIYQFRIIDKKGNIRWMEINVVLITWEGRPATLSFLSDITQRKQAEQALMESERKYRTLFEGSRDAIYISTLDGRLTDFNQAMIDLLGYTKEEMATIDAKKTYADPGDRRRFQQAIEQQGAVKDFEVRLRMKVGTEMDCLLTATLRKDHCGNILGYEGIIRDITERKWFERLLRQERETFFSIMQKAPYGVILIDTDGTHLYINPEYTAITGYTIKDVPTGKDWFRKAFPHPECRQKAIAQWTEDLARKGVDRAWNVVCKNGEVKDIEIRPTCLDDGRIIVMISDVTERKRTEEELAYRATHDLLTGLPNRILFKDRFNMAMAQAQRINKKLAVMFLDLDRFKEVNDTLGHIMGDKVLYAVSNRLTGLLRKTDTVARLGGDEFLLLLHDIDRVEDAITVAEKILEDFREPFVVDGHKIYITTSIGIAIYPNDGEDVDTLVSLADKAMYKAKQGGHDSYQYSPQTITGQTSE